MIKMTETRFCAIDRGESLPELPDNDSPPFYYDPDGWGACPDLDKAASFVISRRYDEENGKPLSEWTPPELWAIRGGRLTQADFHDEKTYESVTNTGLFGEEMTEVKDG